MNLSYQKIQEDPDLMEDFGWPLEFIIDRASRDYSWIKFQPDCEFQVLAGDACGGAFAAYGSGALESRPIMHVSSEGQAGKVAENLAQMLRLDFKKDVINAVLDGTGIGPGMAGQRALGVP